MSWRGHVEPLRALLRSGDLERIDQALALAESLGEPALVDWFLGDTRPDSEGDFGVFTVLDRPTLAGGVGPELQPLAPLYATYAALALLAARPERAEGISGILLCGSEAGGQLTRLPESIGALKGIQRLQIERCPLVSLPASIGEMSGLTDLSIEDAPPWIRELGALERIGVDRHNTKLRDALRARCGENTRIVS